MQPEDELLVVLPEELVLEVLLVEVLVLEVLVLEVLLVEDEVLELEQFSTAVPRQEPPEQASPVVQGLLSLHEAVLLV